MAAISTIIQASPMLSSPRASVATVIQPSVPQSGLSMTASSPVVGQQQSASQPSLKDVQQAVKQANMSLPSSNEAITFGYEEKLGRLIVQVSDKVTGRVIQQLPSKEFVQYQIYMKEMVGLLLDKQV